jgi:hypothetical protein
MPSGRLRARQPPEVDNLQLLALRTRSNDFKDLEILASASR